jgi:hypothetical protein
LRDRLSSRRPVAFAALAAVRARREGWQGRKHHDSFGRKILSLYYGSDSARADVLLAISHARHGKHRLVPEPGNKDNLYFGP